MRQIFFGLLIICCVIGLGLYTQSQNLTQKTYPALLDENSNVYDGDTIQNCYIDIADLRTKYEPETLWLGIFRKGTDLYAVTDIRIKGIDTPETRPSTKYDDGTPRPEVEREAERKAAALAKTELRMLLEGNNMEFVVANPEPDKYFGRVVADVIIDGLDVTDYLIEKKLAVPYDGGHKMEYHEMLEYWEEN